MTTIFDFAYACLLKKYREANREKQSALASNLNLKQSTISKLESGNAHFDDALLKAICIHFKISLNDFKKEAKEKIKQEVTLVTPFENNYTHHEVIILELKKRIKQLELECLKLSTEAKRIQNFSDTLGKDYVHPIYVML